jgi:hypothetical protein
MHIVVFAEDESNSDRISRLLAESEIESCDLFVGAWSNQQKVTACLGAIRKNYGGEVYLITETIPVPSWAFELDAPVSIVWKDQDPADLALCGGSFEVDLWSTNHLDVLDQMKAVTHFLSDKPLKTRKPVKIKCDRTVYGLKEDFFRL